MIPTRVVKATKDDLATIESIARRTWPDTFADILTPEQIEYMLNMMYREESLLRQLEEGHVFHLVLTADNDPMYPSESKDYSGRNVFRYRAVGYISHQLDYRPGITKIHKIYVLPGSQGQGLGKTLIKRVTKLAKSAGQERLRLDVNYQNPAVGFYESLGFEKLERSDTDIGNGFLMEDWVMEKSL